MSASAVTQPNNRWIFDEHRVVNTPSKRDGIGHQQEMQLRQRGTHNIKEMADLLKLLPICTNTAIVYFHRFFALRSFKAFDVIEISICSLYLSAKFEEQPILMQHLIRAAMHLRPSLTKQTDETEFRRLCDRLVSNENEMLLTFGFDLMVTHPQSVIGQLVREHPSVIHKSVCYAAYHMAADLLRLSTICLQHSHQFVVCVCLYLSSHFLKKPVTTNGVQNWWHLVDSSVRYEDVKRVSLKFKPYISPKCKYLTVNTSDSTAINSTTDKKRKMSYDDPYSPESAYSSGSNTSPDDYNNIPTPPATVTAKPALPLAPQPPAKRVKQSAVTLTSIPSKMAAPPALAKGGASKTRLNLRVSLSTDSKRQVVIL